MRRTARGLVAVVLVLVAACGGSTDTGAAETTATSATPSGSDQGSATTVAATQTTVGESNTDEPADQPSQGNSAGSIDGSDINWATVDLTTIDWANIDMTTIDMMAIRDNPTAADLDEATTTLIASRIFPGSATLTIGNEVWEFDSFDCAFGHDNTESAVYSFTSNSFGEHSDGTRVQMQANVRNESGDGRVEGDGLTHELFINDIEDFENPVVDWQAGPPVGITLNGDSVTFSGDFDNGLTDEVEAVPGTLEAECSTTSRR